MGIGTGRMAELHIGIFLGCLQHMGLMTETVGEHNLATLVCQVAGCLVAGVAFRDISLHQNLLVGQTQCGLHSLHGVDEVQVIGRIFIVQQNNADLEIGRNLEILFQFNLGNQRCALTEFFAVLL